MPTRRIPAMLMVDGCISGTILTPLEFSTDLPWISLSLIGWPSAADAARAPKAKMTLGRTIAISFARWRATQVLVSAALGERLAPVLDDGQHFTVSLK